MSHLNFVRAALILAMTVAASGGNGVGAATLDISGRYDGTVQDTVFGSGELAGDFPQYRDSVSGTLQFVFGSIENLTPASFLLNGTSLNGNGVIVNVFGGFCPISITATYTSSGGLKGSYKVINTRCSENAGTFTLQHICSYGDGTAVEFKEKLKRC